MYKLIDEVLTACHMLLDNKIFFVILQYLAYGIGVVIALRMLPLIQTLIIAGAGKGTTMVVQRFVRITRQHKESGKVKGKVIDYMDNFSSLSLRQSQKRLKAYSEYLGFDVKII